jgi:hypothetical protein
MRTIGFLFLLILTLPGFSQSLTLKEKQAVANLDFSWAEKRILDNYGSAVKIVLDQATFSNDMDVISYAESRGATHVANAIASICGDNLGKEALQGKKIVKVLLKNDKASSPKVAIEKGLMTLFIGFSTSDKYFTEAAMKEAIENLL